MKGTLLPVSISSHPKHGSCNVSISCSITIGSQEFKHTEVCISSKVLVFSSIWTVAGHYSRWARTDMECSGVM